jgi:raffinose/stachyose/melibiose transport system substrate-binding protein
MKRLTIILVTLWCSLAPTSWSAEPKEITMWITDFNREQFDLFNKIVISPFNATQSDYTVKAQLVQQYDRQLKLALSAGKGPDVLFTEGPTYLVQYIKNGFVIPLDTYAKKYGWDKRFIKATLDLQVLGGKLYGLPDEYESVFLYYNKTLFAKNGWEPPKNLADLKKIAEDAKSKGITPLSGGNANWKGTNEWFITAVLNSYAGQENVAKALKGELPWTSPVFVEAFKMLNDWWKDGWFSKSYYALTGEQAVSELTSGKAAMLISGSWAIGQLQSYSKQTGQDWDWVPIPALSSQAGYPLYALGIGGTMSISKNCKSPDGAAQFLDFMYTPKTFFAWTEAAPATGQLLPPVNLQPDESKTLKADPRMIHQNDEVTASIAANNAGYCTWTFWPDRTEQYMIDGIEKVWAGQLTVEDYLSKVNEQYQQDMKDDRVPPLMQPASPK